MAQTGTDAARSPQRESQAPSPGGGAQQRAPGRREPELLQQTRMAFPTRIWSGGSDPPYRGRPGTLTLRKRQLLLLRPPLGMPEWGHDWELDAGPPNPFPPFLFRSASRAEKERGGGGGLGGAHLAPNRRPAGTCPAEALPESAKTARSVKISARFRRKVLDRKPCP